MHDNVGLFEALNANERVVPIFIFDTTILDKLEDKDDRRVTFIHQQVQQLRNELATHNASIHVYHGNPLEVFPKVLEDYSVSTVYTNRDYEPAALERDDAIKHLLTERGIAF